MKASELRELLLYAPHTEENYRRLPKEAGGIWWSRPSRNVYATGTKWLYLRLSLLAIASVYLLYFHRDIGEARVLLFVVAAYEFAYYNTWKEKAKFESIFADERYEASVDDLLAKLYPKERS